MMRFLFLATAICFFTSSCKMTEGLTPSQRTAITGAVGLSVGLAENVANLAVQYVVNQATGSADLSKKADRLDSLAASLRTLQSNGPGGAIEAGLIISTATAATDPTKTHWNDLASQLAAQILAAPVSQNAALESSAVALNSVAANARTAAAQPTQP